MQQKETIDRLSEAIAPCTKKQGIIARTLKNIFSVFKHIPIIPLRG